MCPKIFMWSDYGAPTQKRWRSPSRRSTRSSIGPKILVVAGGVVAGIIGISGIYPQIIDADWVQSAGTDTPHSENVANGATTTRRSGIVAAIPLPPRRVAMTTGEAAVPAPRPAAPTPASAPEPEPEPELSEMGSSVAAVELPPSETAPPLADIPDAQAKADPPAEPAVAPAARTKPVGRLVEGLRAPVRQRVVRVVHHRSYSGAYAQYGGWGGWGGGWGRF
jgi:hypothetical protein